MVSLHSYSVLTLMAWWQETHPACKKSHTSIPQKLYFIQTLEGHGLIQ